jgi:ankyrin repeat protein
MPRRDDSDSAARQASDTPLHRAAARDDVAAIEHFLADSNNAWAINARNAVGQAPLHCAVLGGFDAAVRALLEHGADPNLVDPFGILPLSTAEDDFGLDRVAAVLRQFGASKG